MVKIWWKVYHGVAWGNVQFNWSPRCGGGWVPKIPGLEPYFKEVIARVSPILNLHHLQKNSWSILASLWSSITNYNLQTNNQHWIDSEITKSQQVSKHRSIFGSPNSIHTLLISNLNSQIRNRNRRTREEKSQERPLNILLIPNPGFPNQKSQEENWRRKNEYLIFGECWLLRWISEWRLARPESRTPRIAIQQASWLQWGVSDDGRWGRSDLRRNSGNRSIHFLSLQSFI